MNSLKRWMDAIGFERPLSSYYTTSDRPVATLAMGRLPQDFVAVRAWCEEHGCTEPFIDSGQWWAFPPQWGDACADRGDLVE